MYFEQKVQLLYFARTLRENENFARLEISGIKQCPYRNITKT